VVVLSHGGVVALEGWHDDVDAIVDGSLLGQAGGSALVDVLLGVVNPSGRLAESIPRRLEDTPAFGTFPGEHRRVVYGERTLVGYRWYATRDVPIRYPFGHGLSYTTFDTRDFRVDVTGADTAVVRVTVDNTGARDGAYVVQVYVDATAVGVVQRSARELRAFKKVQVPAGESVAVELPLDRRSFAYWDVDLGDWAVTPGTYRVIVGRDALAVEWETTVELAGDEIVRELSLWSTAQEWFDHPIVGPKILDAFDSDLLRMLARPESLRMLGSLPMQKIVNLLGDVADPETIESLMHLTRREGIRQ
jgi:beta-glucosidase